MDTIHGALDRARVVLTSVVTIATAVAVALTTIVIPAAADAYGAESDIVTGLAQAVVLLGSIVTVIRRVTPVPADERGLLPVDED